MNETLTISIVTANFNNAPFLDDFFKSVKESSLLPTELVIVDDASTDDSMKIIHKWEKQYPCPITIIELERNIGFANAINLAIEESKGDLVLRIDPDDFLHEKRVELEYNYLCANPEVDIIGSNTYYYNNTLKKVVGKSSFPISVHKINKGIQKGIITLSNGSFTSRKEVLLQTRYKQEFFGFEEYVLFAEMVKNGVTIKNLPQTLTYYRVDNQNRNIHHMLRVQKGISNQRRKIFGKGNTLITIYTRALSAYLYWSALRATSKIGFIFFLSLTIPFKINRISRLTDRFTEQ